MSFQRPTPRIQSVDLEFFVLDEDDDFEDAEEGMEFSSHTDQRVLVKDMVAVSI